MIGAALHGFLAGAGLIIAIGAQNAFVLRQGLRRQHVWLVVLICALSDLVLIMAGTVGIGALVSTAGWLLLALRWLGVAYLIWFAVQSFRSAASTHELDTSTQADAREASRNSIRAVVVTTLALTWLNPHVYLDTVVMLGNLANQHGNQRWGFAAGAGTASVVWFTTLGFGARLLSGPLGKPRVWRILDVLIGLVMLAVAALLAFG